MIYKVEIYITNRIFYIVKKQELHDAATEGCCLILKEKVSPSSVVSEGPAAC